jgi:hypothetical protein
MVLFRSAAPRPGASWSNKPTKRQPSMRTELREGYTRGVVTKSLTALDANRALTLLEPFHGHDRNAGFVATSLGKKDPT